MKQTRFKMRTEDKWLTEKQWLKLATSVLIVIKRKNGNMSYVFNNHGWLHECWETLDLWRGLKKDKYKYEPLEVEYGIEQEKEKLEYYLKSKHYQENKDKYESIEVRTFTYKERMKYYKWYKENY